MSAAGLLNVFVYGTLKRGQSNHARHSQSLVSVERAVIWGRLYQLPVGYPMLEVPKLRALAHGTTDYEADLNAQLSIAAKLESNSELLEQPTDCDWQQVSGEILRYSDVNMLALLDELESFKQPLGPTLYVRVLAIAESSRPELVWIYVAPKHGLPIGAKRIGPAWPNLPG